MVDNDADSTASKDIDDDIEMYGVSPSANEGGKTGGAPIKASAYNYVKNASSVDMQNVQVVPHYIDANKPAKSSKSSYFGLCYQILLHLIIIYLLIGVTYLLSTTSSCECSTSAATQTANTVSTNITTFDPTQAPSPTPTASPITAAPIISPTGSPTVSIEPTVSPTTSPTIELSAIPDVGDFKISARNSSHGNWLLCDGTSFSPNVHPELFSVIGYSFGSEIVGTVNQFRLPNPTDRVVGMVGDSYELGEERGSETVTLSTANIPRHTHFLMKNVVSGDLGYTSSRPYLARSNNEGDRSYDLYNTALTPDNTIVGYTGSGSAVNIVQPTIHIGHLFIYAD